jgi:hypothetical protein
LARRRAPARGRRAGRGNFGEGAGVASFLAAAEEGANKDKIYGIFEKRLTDKNKNRQPEVKSGSRFGQNFAKLTFAPTFSIALATCHQAWKYPPNKSRLTILTLPSDRSWQRKFRG